MNIEDKVALACKEVGIDMIDFTKIKPNESMNGVKCQFQRASLADEITHTKAIVNIRMDCFKGGKSKRILAKVFDGSQECVNISIKNLKAESEKLMGDL